MTDWIGIIGVFAGVVWGLFVFALLVGALMGPLLIAATSGSDEDET